MKKLLFAVLPAILLSCQGGYTISGTAPEGADSVSLNRLVGKKQVNVTTVPVAADGTYSFTGCAETPYMAYLVSGNTFIADLCVTNDAITVTEGVAMGGLENALYASVCGSADFSDADASYAMMDSLTKAAPGSTALSYVLFRKLYNTLSVDRLEELESRFSDEVRSNDYLTILRQLIAQSRLSEVGKPMLDFTSVTPEGDSLALSSLSGKWILLDFWASWCPYCRIDNPNVVKTYEAYHSKGLEILYVSLDSDRDEWIKAIEADSLQWNHVSDLDGWDCSPARMYGVSAIPSNIIIAPDGTIAARQMHGGELDAFLAENIKK